MYTVHIAVTHVTAGEANDSFPDNILNQTVLCTRVKAPVPVCKDITPSYNIDYPQVAKARIDPTGHSKISLLPTVDGAPAAR